MLNSNKKTQAKRRKRAAELIGLCSEVRICYPNFDLELKRRSHCGKLEKNDFCVHVRS